jgi:N-methylhydantoinase A
MCESKAGAKGGFVLNSDQIVETREMSVGIEVGGTFTDWVVVRRGRVIRTGKVLSTPGRPEVGVLHALQEAAVTPGELGALLHGSTVATNVVVERKGPECALITTQGFRDVIFIQRQAKTRLFDLRYTQPEALVTRDRVLEVDEKMGPNGISRRPLRMNGLLESVDNLIRNERVQSVAVCLLHSYGNPAHEEEIEVALRKRFPDLYITLSSSVVPQFREYERTSTCLMSAYTKPVVDRYISKLEQSLQEGGYHCRFSVIQANGGSVPASAIRQHAVKMVLSGPAAGVVGATAAAKRAGIPNIITFDMGGTSTDVCLVDNGQPRVTTDYKIDGLPLQLPMIDITTVGAGGGSIARIDRGGILQVGPSSAGADPGPACYGQGGEEFTVTDANVALGYLRPQQFFGGKMSLDVPAAEQALKRLADALEMSPLTAAEGVRQLVNVNMARAVRLVSVERGYDPREYTIVAYGGGGPLHAASLAGELGIQQVLVPANAGLVSAYGLLIANTQQDFMVTRISRAIEVRFEDLATTFGSLENRARNEFADYGMAQDEVRIHHFIDMRYVGQAYELTVPVEEFTSGARPMAELAQSFHEFHFKRYGHALTQADVEVVSYRIIAVRASELHDIDPAPSDATPRPPGDGLIAIDGRSVVCRFYDRAGLVTGDQLPGPAVIEEPTATTFVPVGWTATVDAFLNVLLRRDD